MFLLNGDICPKLKPFTKSLRSSPKNVVKRWSNNTTHVVNFVNRLIAKQIADRDKLLRVWDTDANCKWTGYYLGEDIMTKILVLFTVLLQEFCDFLVDGKQSEIALNWPPIA